MRVDSSCPESVILKQFLLGRLAAAEVEHWAPHIEQCAACVNAMSAMGDKDRVIETMRGAARAETERGHPLVQSLIGKLSKWRSAFDATEQGAAPVPGSSSQEYAGQWIGAYMLIEKLGQGGMGTVWVAEQEHPVKRQVALKLIKAGMDSAKVIRRFEAERQTLALMDHSNIAMVLDAGATETGRPYIVMELVKGEPITSYCDEHRLTVAQRLELFVSVCQAIQHAHQKSIIHRDIKPSNILVCRKDGAPMCKVIDFGVAKALQKEVSQETATEFGVVVGTLEYMSPEQAALSLLDVDTRSDVYSLGVLLYELLTGDTPLGAERLCTAALDEALRMIRQEEPVRPSVRLAQAKDELAGLAAARGVEPTRLLKQVRGDIDWIVMRALEKDRQRRYDAASSLARDIERYLHGEPVDACPPSAGYKLRKFLTKHKKSAIAASLIVLLLVAGVIGTTLGLLAARMERDEARQQAAIARAVNDFLHKDLLSQADPANQTLDHDPNIKVRTLLDRAAQTIAQKFAGQPLTEAAIRMTLGNAYTALGQLAEAERHLDRALRLHLESRGPEHVDTLASKNSLAELLLHKGHYAEAERLLAEVVGGRTRKLGADHQDTLTSKHNLAALYYEQGKHAQAQALFQEVLTASAASLGTDHEDTLASMNGLALVYQAMGQLKLAEPLLAGVLKVSHDRLGDDHPHTLRSKSNLAMLYQEKREYERAEPLLQEVLKARVATLNEAHPLTLNSKENVALLWEAQGKYPQAEDLLREVLRIRTDTLGHDHPDTLRARQNLAVMAHAQGQHEQAEALLRELVRDWSAKVGPEHPDTQTGKAILAGVLRSQKKFAEAETLCNEVWHSRTAALGPDHPKTLLSERDLVQVYQEQGKHAAAEKLLAARRQRK